MKDGLEELIVGSHLLRIGDLGAMKGTTLDETVIANVTYSQVKRNCRKKYLSFGAGGALLSSLLHLQSIHFFTSVLKLNLIDSLDVYQLVCYHFLIAYNSHPTTISASLPVDRNV